MAAGASRIGIAMRELQARQLLRQMRWQVGQIGQVEDELGYRYRFAVPAQGVLQAVGLEGTLSITAVASVSLGGAHRRSY